MSAQVPTQLSSALTCPNCGHCKTDVMPTGSCTYLYECGGCGELLKPLPGDCRVFCSYGTVPCPPVQNAKGSCCG
ncbi:MAG TPA: GDCCVxC domain-containing (seleno)protein [Rudaea sp.]|uniref:GDCCVxC domain-containing (seleno)protein n=1 Tax=Rudaea sp. TaxID=2136325 RepID=UPI002F9443AB